MHRKNRDSVWQGVDTRRANSARREIAYQAEQDRLRNQPQRPQAQMPGCTVLCHKVNHSQACPNRVLCDGCGHGEFNRYEYFCLACGTALGANVLAKHGL